MYTAIQTNKRTNTAEGSSTKLLFVGVEYKLADRSVYSSLESCSTDQCVNFMQYLLYVKLWNVFAIIQLYVWICLVGTAL